MRKLFAIVLCLAMCVGVFAMTASAAGDYYVAGNAGLCNGVEWGVADPANVMTANADGTYSITYKNVAAGYYEFKVTNGTWDSCWPGSNYQLNLEASGDVTITFDPATQEITVDAAGIGEVTAPDIASMAVVGSGVEALNNWGADLVMTCVSEGVYTYTFENVANAELAIKFRANNNWNDYNFGGVYAASGEESAADWNGSDIKVSVTEASNVTVKLDLTKFDYETKSGAAFTITVTAVTGTEDKTEDKTEQTAAPTEGTTETVTVHAKVPADWTAVAAYVWDGNGTDNTWPGVAMTKGADGWYTAELPAWASNIIINNGGNGSQTQDISIEAGKDLWITVEADGYGFAGTVSYAAPKTGDETALIGAAAIMLMAVAAVAVTVGGRKKIFK